MTFENYADEWEKDAPIDPSELGEAAQNVPVLHAKYWKYYVAERLRFKKLDYEYKSLYQLRYEYWWGRLDDAVRKEHNWPIQPLKILTPQLSVYLDADPVLQELLKRRTIVEETLKFLEDIIKQINGRGYHVKNCLDFLRFKMGT